MSCKLIQLPNSLSHPGPVDCLHMFIKVTGLKVKTNIFSYMVVLRDNWEQNH